MFFWLWSRTPGCWVSEVNGERVLKMDLRLISGWGQNPWDLREVLSEKTAISGSEEVETDACNPDH
jgi:hypothetical protein